MTPEEMTEREQLLEDIIDLICTEPGQRRMNYNKAMLTPKINALFARAEKAEKALSEIRDIEKTDNDVIVALDRIARVLDDYYGDPHV